MLVNFELITLNFQFIPTLGAHFLQPLRIGQENIEETGQGQLRQGLYIISKKGIINENKPKK